jgi:mannose-6-phosphate isomerase class I
MIYETVPRAVRRIWGALSDGEGRPVGEMYWLSHDAEGSSGLVDAAGGRATVAGLVESGRLPRAGEGVYPLLVKTLHPARKLSVQVHPGAFGGPRKDETWIVLEADDGAWMMGGLRDGVGREEFEAAIRNGRAGDVMSRVGLHAGDVVHIPAGAVHSLGGGVEILEVQTNTDVTYRLYDWNRTGADGNPRPLHLEEGLDAVDYARQGRPVQLPCPGELSGVPAPYRLRRVSGPAELEGGELLFVTSGMVLLGGRRIAARGCLLADSGGGRVDLAGEGVAAAPAEP